MEGRATFFTGTVQRVEWAATGERKAPVPRASDVVARVRCQRVSVGSARHERRRTHAHADIVVEDLRQIGIDWRQGIRRVPTH